MRNPSSCEEEEDLTEEVRERSVGKEGRERPSYRNNYKGRVVGPWVVGVYQNRASVRFLFWRTGRAVHYEISLEEVWRRRVVRTYEWRGCSRPSEDGYIHQKVYHSKWFVDPVSGSHTQGIERMWVDAKSGLREHRRPTHLLQSHLDEIAWRKRNTNSTTTLIESFWRDVRRVFDITNLQ